MLERIVKLRIPVHKALLDLNIDVKLNDEEFQQINNIVQALDPIKLAVEALCRREANLITAEPTIKILFDEIQTYPATEYNIRIIGAINQRSVQERYIEASVIMAYLHNPMAKLKKNGVVRTFCDTIIHILKYICTFISLNYSDLHKTSRFDCEKWISIKKQCEKWISIKTPVYAQCLSTLLFHQNGQLILLGVIGRL